jgi:flagellar motility protein MotE (MotC chaperone)
LEELEQARESGRAAADGQQKTQPQYQKAKKDMDTLKERLKKVEQDMAAVVKARKKGRRRRR